MSLSTSLANAMTGLSASSRSAQVVSANIANALTDGYGRREIELSAQSLGGKGAGVNVVGVNRHVDPILLADRRLAQSDLGNASVLSKYFDKLENAIGIPGEPGSLENSISKLEGAFIEASSRPDSDLRLQNVVTSAQDLAQNINGISRDIQNLRSLADQEIASQVEYLNKNLGRVEDLNKQILSQTNTGRDANALLDQRQATIDAIADIIPIKQVDLDNQTVSIFSTGGGVLIDGKAGKFEFQSVGTIVPEMTLASGALSGLSFNGHPVNTAAERNAIDGGSLSALFDVRDSHLVEAQAELDALSRNLIERFSDPSIDSTSTGGLFTDGGLDFNPANETAVSERLKVSSIVIPNEGGEAWRLRDGLGALTLGNAGDASLINRMLTTLSDPKAMATGNLSSSNQSFGEFASNLASFVGIQKYNFNAEQVYAATKTDSLITHELANGVDTDQEMQQLLLVERSYAANAKIIQSIDQLFDLLLGM